MRYNIGRVCRRTFRYPQAACALRNRIAGNARTMPRHTRRRFIAFPPGLSAPPRCVCAPSRALRGRCSSTMRNPRRNGSRLFRSATGGSEQWCSATRGMNGFSSMKTPFGPAVHTWMNPEALSVLPQVRKAVLEEADYTRGRWATPEMQGPYGGVPNQLPICCCAQQHAVAGVSTGN